MMQQGLFDLAGTFSPKTNYNKKIVRQYMAELGFPREIHNMGFNWDKKGWGGTCEPYFVDWWLRRIEPERVRAKDWFTEHGLKIYAQRGRTPAGYLMTMFLKILELRDERPEDWDWVMAWDWGIER